MSAQTRTAYRAMSALFSLWTVFVLVWFVHLAMPRPHQIHTGLLLYAGIMALEAYAFWTMRWWARGSATVIMLANGALGTLAVIAWIVDHRGSIVLPLVFVAVNVALSFVVARPVYVLPARDR